jgi:hypothetical protein
MKLVKSFVLAALLVSTLAFNVFAGDIETPGYVAPPPPTRSTTTTDGDTTSSNTDQYGSTTETSDYLLFDALAVILSVY